MTTVLFGTLVMLLVMSLVKGKTENAVIVSTCLNVWILIPRLLVLYKFIRLNLFIHWHNVFDLRNFGHHIWHIFDFIITKDNRLHFILLMISYITSRLNVLYKVTMISTLQCHGKAMIVQQGRYYSSVLNICFPSNNTLSHSR